MDISAGVCARDFDGYGVPGWAWSDVVEHFRAIETDLDFTGPAHGDSGPIPVRRTREIIGSTATFVDAAQGTDSAGYLISTMWATAPDCRRASGPSRSTSSTARASVRARRFCCPRWNAPNLTLLTQTRAVRLRFSGSRAVGVDAIGPGGPVTLTADRIVLSAGAIESAHLLMLSGIGDEAVLRAAGVEVVARLPVGMACSDHPEWVLPTTWEVAAGRPPLEVVLSTPDDVEIRPYTGGFVAMVGDGTPGHPDWPHIGVALMRPLARGRVTLVSADPLVPPEDRAPLRQRARRRSRTAGTAAIWLAN